MKNTGLSRHAAPYFSHSSESKIFKFFTVRCFHAIGKKPFATEMLFTNLILDVKFTTRPKSRPPF